MEYDLVVLGDINADLILRGADPVPTFRQVEKLVDSGLLTIGGSSTITACGAARLGLRTAFIGVVGDDALGHFMLSALRERGVDMSHCLVDPALATGITVIFARTGADDRALLTAPGSIGALRADQVDRALLRRARHLHCGAFFLQGEALRAGLPELFAAAHAQGSTTSLDTNWDPSERWDGGLGAALAQCDIFFPNREEALRVTGAADLEAALGQLAGGRAVVAKLGSSGAELRAPTGRWRARPPAVSVVDATGAGDSFNAGYLYGHLAGWGLERSLALAVACGTLSTQAQGGTAGQPTLEQAQALLERVTTQTIHHGDLPLRG